MPLQTLVSVVLFLAIASQLNINCYASAKGSNQASKKCQQYGHSCLGGHGKRSSPSSSSFSSMQIPLFSSSRVSSLAGPRAYSAGSPLSSSTEQLYFGGAGSSRPSYSSSSHFLSSSNKNFPLVYSLLSSAFPSRKHQLQQSNWKSLPQDSSSSNSADIADWAAAAEQAATDYLVPLPPVSGIPTGTDPDGDLREGLGSTFIIGSSGSGNFHRVPNAVAAAAAAHQPTFFQSSLKKAEEAEAAGGKGSEWELPSPMKKAASALARFRRSLIAGGKVGSLQQTAVVVKGGAH